jgi:arylsulfate sulfotransferase
MISTRKLSVAGCMIATGLALSGAGMATPVIGVPATSVASPQPLGTTVTISYSATDTDAGVISYRVEIGPAGSSKLTMVRDYSVDTSFVYTPTQHSGNFQFVVVARNNTTGNTATASVPSFKFTSLVKGSAPVVTPTSNPLVALYSAPPCAAGGVNMRVSLLKAGATLPFYTNSVTCQAGEDLNFILAGMRAATSYTVIGQTWNGSTYTNGPTLTYITGTPTVTFPTLTIPVPLTSADNQTERFLLMSTTSPQFPIAVDLSGTAVWYYLDPSGAVPTVTRPVFGGTILLLANGQNSAGTSVNQTQILREINLGGNIVHETNATLIAEQITAMSGIQSQCYVGGTDCLIGAFDHEALRMPNGYTLVQGSEEQIFTNGTQGSSPTNPVDILGDIIVVLNTDWQVVWYWRAFDWLDVNRAAVLGETCVNGQGGCPPVLLTTGIAQDWLHGNAEQFEPSDGSILFSMRHQDWIDKINYDNGAGDGSVIWTLGLDGDFTIDSSVPYPWFSHQHDPGFLSGGETVLAMFDNGNTRVSPPPLGLGSGDSRGYVLNVDQVNMVATPIMLADIGFFSEALGTAELLANGDYHFEAGFADATPPYEEAIEVFPSATLSFTMKGPPGMLCYRNFRMQSLYSPPTKD